MQISRKEKVRWPMRGTRPSCRPLFGNDSVNNRSNLRSYQCRLSDLDTDAGRTAHRLQIISTLSRTMDLCPNYSRAVPSRPRLQTPRAAARQPRVQSAGTAPRFPPRIGHSREKCPKTPQLWCIFQAWTNRINTLCISDEKNPKICLNSGAFFGKSSVILNRINYLNIALLVNTSNI